MSATMFDTRSSGVLQRPELSHNGPPMLQGRILVADDSSDGRRTISSILKCMGLKVAAADGGHEAFQLALEAWHDGHPFDLVLMDTEMPELDGYEATVLLRSAGYEGRIVALASCSFKGTRDRYIAAGCDGCASKPISYEMLWETVNRYLPGSRSDRGGLTSKALRERGPLPSTHKVAAAMHKSDRSSMPIPSATQVIRMA